MSDSSSALCNRYCKPILATVALLVAVISLCCNGTPTPLVDSRQSPPPKASDTPAEPANDPVIVDRINLTNYYRVKDGMTYKQVETILGPATEEVASGGGVTLLTWKRLLGANTCITFQNGRVVSKAQFGLLAGEPTPDYVDKKR